MLKTRSVDVRKDPMDVFCDTLEILTSSGFIIKESTWLTPFHADHAAIVCIKPEH
jgi:fibrillarin-like pre-rRNA processing protein